MQQPLNVYLQHLSRTYNRLNTYQIFLFVFDGHWSMLVDVTSRFYVGSVIVRGRKNPLQFAAGSSFTLYSHRWCTAQSGEKKNLKD